MLHPERAKVIEEVLSWEGTPYHPGAECKGAGVDCLTLIVCTFRKACDLEIEVPHYPSDWHLHRSEERYMEGVLQYCTEQLDPLYEPLPGDIVMWKYGRCYAHGAIVTQWPIIIHAYKDHKCGREFVDVAWLHKVGETSEMQGKVRPRKIFTLTRWLDVR